MRRGELYQVLLIALAIAGTAIFTVVIYRELFPEYKIYQKAYVQLEEFRSSYTGRPPAPFKFGIKQIVIPKEDKGPETIDRCISCHVALELEHFSPTKLDVDINGELILDDNGVPKKVPNPDYIFTKLDEKIALLREQGNESEADALAELKVAHVGEHTYEMSQVLQMHPLMGKETRPFEFHPVEEYGCTVCHGGNGRGLVTDRAHGPVFDGTYEESFQGPEPEFLEKDPNGNDPLFSKAYNHKPGHRLLFQTDPLLVGGAIEARCAQCHDPSEKELALPDAVEVKREYDALIELLSLKKWIEDQGVQSVLTKLEEKQKDYTLSEEGLEKLEANIAYLRRALVSAEGDVKKETLILDRVNRDLLSLVGSEETLNKLEASFDQNPDLTLEQVTSIVESGSIHSRQKPRPVSDVNRLTKSYQRGEELFVSQACYACHRITGFARGGVGPELTLEGLSYPWFMKESIVWPQADLKTSTMPNYKLDHQEVEDLMAFLLAQRGQKRSRSDFDEAATNRAWEEGRLKREWEKPLSSDQIRDVRSTMMIFATEGCAACHRLEGFDSQWGVEGHDDQQWFRELFPEEALGSTIVRSLEENAAEIDAKIQKVGEPGLLEKMQEKYPGNMESFYSNFRYASRAKNHELTGEELEAWKARVERVLKVYITEFGFGRLVGPRPNWSGIYRSDQWLMEHFWNPQALIARSIMPVFPFDNTKFLALTYMLDRLAVENRNSLRKVWKERGFHPENAYQQLCAQCHGENLKGNGPVSEWIYPVPKNLNNPIFLRSLTKQKAYESIRYGVAGGPMPPWGEVAEDKPFDMGGPVLTDDEIEKLVNWIFSRLPGRHSEQEVPRWDYTPEDVLRELDESGVQIDQKESRASFFPLGAILGVVAQPISKLSTSELFDEVESPRAGEERKYYYIKDKYYTKKNLEEGEAYFKLNCAVCHGNDADGAGERAEVMEDAKPRMLINLPWVESRDDLRLLRAINYGVTGTSMVAWGNETTPLQRLQLVMYIRSLTKTKRNHEKLKSSLYETYQTKIWEIEAQKAKEVGEIRRLEEEISKLQESRRELEKESFKQGAIASGYQDSFQKEVSLRKELNALKEREAELNEKSATIKKEKQLSENLGNLLFTQFGSGTLLQNYLVILKESDPLKREALEKALIAEIRKEKADLEQRLEVAKAKIPSQEEREEIEDLQTANDATEEVLRTAISTFAQIQKLNQEIGNGKESI